MTNETGSSATIDVKRTVWSKDNEFFSCDALDELLDTHIGYICADDLKELASGNGAVVSPKGRETDVPVFARAASANATGAEEATTEAAMRKTMTSEQIRLERKLTCEAIDGAIALGYQNTNAPPSDDHWLATYWRMGQKLAELDALPASARYPTAWVRFRSDGGFEGPIMDSDERMCDVRRKSGAWTPLFGSPAMAAEASQPAQQPGERVPEAAAIGEHDLSTSDGGRSYVAEFFAKRLHRHDFGSYIKERLAADFACALAQYLSDRDTVPQPPSPTTCTCPSGDWSLRWPCPMHPPRRTSAELTDDDKRDAERYRAHIKYEYETLYMPRAEKKGLRPLAFAEYKASADQVADAARTQGSQS
ncbi:hypothetical protein [Burkholderia thailandensis]|uniref:hypothetical protein n=1 Tax=Burkholderia thailandensis TaxID=57975 RepID=UPI000306A9E1|nr:hypothetical protein [Burkholderia thailandensis]